MLRHCLQLQRFYVSERLRIPEARDIGNRRRRTGVNEHVLAFYHPVGALVHPHMDLARRDKVSGAQHEFHSRGNKRLEVDVDHAVDHGTHVPCDLCHIGCGASGRLTMGRLIAAYVSNPRVLDQGLGRDTCHIDT